MYYNCHYSLDINRCDMFYPYTWRKNMVKELIIDSKMRYFKGKLKVKFSKYANTGNTAIL